MCPEQQMGTNSAVVQLQYEDLQGTSPQGKESILNALEEVLPCVRQKRKSQPVVVPHAWTVVYCTCA